MSRRRRWIAGLAGLGLLAGVAFAPPSTATEAVFTDAEHATTPAMTALRLVPPQITAIPTCRHPLLGGTSVGITWTWIANDPPYSTMTTANAQWSIGGGAWQTRTTTGTGPYTTSFPVSVLEGVLGSLLGTTYTIRMRTAWTTPGGVIWTSPSVSTVTVIVPALLGAQTCTPANGT